MLSPGDVINGTYQITRALGEGGMGAVFDARHVGTNGRVAVKVILSEDLSKSADMAARFRQEARAAGSIRSDFVARVQDNGIDSAGRPYIVMEFLEGEDLQHALRRIGRLSPDVALRIVAQACLGLQRAHEAGVVHRDIKPANLFLARVDGGEVRVKLLDFGVAKVGIDQLTSGAKKSLTHTGAILGSPLYMSPEQVKQAKVVDHKTDIWSLGLVLYELLSGVNPFGHLQTLLELLNHITSAQIVPIRERVPSAPSGVAEVVDKALALDKDARYASAEAMFAAVRSLLSDYRLDQSMLAATAEMETSQTSGDSPSDRVALRVSGDIDAVANTVPANASVGVGARTSWPRRTRIAVAVVSGASALVAGVAGVYRLVPRTHATVVPSRTATSAASVAESTSPMTSIEPNGTAPVVSSDVSRSARATDVQNVVRNAVAPDPTSRLAPPKNRPSPVQQPIRSDAAAPMAPTPATGDVDPFRNRNSFGGP